MVAACRKQVTINGPKFISYSDHDDRDKAPLDVGKLLKHEELLKDLHELCPNLAFKNADLDSSLDTILKEFNEKWKLSDNGARD